MRRVEGYLSKFAQASWPDALVFSEDGAAYVLERAGAETLQLGDNFRDAKRALDALRQAERKGQST